MSFSLSNTSIPTFNQLQGLFNAAPKESGVITIDYSDAGSSTVIPFGGLLGCHVINIINISGGPGTVALPQNSELLALFLEPDVKSVITYILEVDATVTITSDDNTGGWQTINAGVYTLLLQITNKTTPTFDVKISSLGASSISAPSTLQLTVANGETTTIPAGSVLSRFITPGQYGLSCIELTSSGSVTAANLQLPTVENFVTIYGGGTPTIPVTISFYVINNVVGGTGTITLTDSVDIFASNGTNGALTFVRLQIVLLTITIFPNNGTPFGSASVSLVTDTNGLP